MFGIGKKFGSNSLNTLGKGVADYLHSSGEIVLLSNRVEGIPMVAEIENDHSSYKQVRATTRFIFDCGVIWGMAYLFLRDEEYKELDEQKAEQKATESINEFIKEVLKYVGKYEYDLPKEYNHKIIINQELESRVGGEDSPFKKGLIFAGTFLKEFYKIEFS